MLACFGLHQASAQTTASNPPEGERVIELSPFEVDASKNIGYYAESTLAGSRLNTNVGDLAASITVVTKQQLVDTASIDINDVFLYEANTEGTGNFTDINIDTRGAVQDRAAGFQGGAPSLPFTPYTSNRIRGIPTSVDKMRDYYPGTARLPFDAYNTESIEINRGPNSILFGLGNPAGIINQTVARARINQSSNQVEARIGTNSAFRSSVAFNRTLVDDKLAVYVAALYDERGFARKPSHDVTRRQYGALTFKPFKNTTIRANAEFYENDNRRPNAVTPRDFVTPWIEAGRPSYNPVTRMLTINGVTKGPYDGASAVGITNLRVDSLGTIAFEGANANGANRPVQLFDGDLGEIGWIMRHISSTPNVAGVAAEFTYNTPFRTTRSEGPYRYRNLPAPGSPAGLAFAQRGVNDQSIYDWEKINIIAGNFGEDQAKTYNFELEQKLLPNLDLQLGWYKEDFDSSVQYYISQQTGVTLYVDTNVVNLDGTPNANFGRPYVEVIAPDGFEHPENNNVGRATLAYDLNFTEKDGWMRWLGRHRLMGLGQRHDQERYQLRNRPYISTFNQFLPVVPNVWAGNRTQNTIERRFYVGNNTGAVTQAPTLYPNGTRTSTLRWFNPSATGTDANTGLNGAWQNTPLTVDTALHFVSSHTKQRIDSAAFAAQSYFLDDRVITTFGRRRDSSTARNSLGLAIRADGMTDPSNLENFGAAQEVAGYTTSYGVVVKVLPWLSLHYNKSDNFNVAGLQTDFFGTPLSLPTGEGEDYGFSVTLLENKLTAKVNWYEASQEGARGAVVAQPLTRTITIDDTFFRAWAQWVTGSATNNSAAVNNILRLPELHTAADPGTFFGIPVTGTSTVASEGKEIQLIYNPIPNWTLKFTAGQQKTVYDKIAPEWDAWVDKRMEIWTTATAAGFPNFWQTTGTDLEGSGLGGFGLGATQTVQDWWITNVEGIMNTAKRNEGKVTQEQREWRANVITNYQFTEGRFAGVGVGGAIRWEDKAAIGYLAAPADPDGVLRLLDNNQPVFDDSETSFDFWMSYTMRRTPFFGDKVRTKIQLNIRDAFENGGLKPISANPDGEHVAFRIVEPRQWFLTTTFDF
ncbi:hypothetical protein ASA1KI_18580 [Opitutales bacterium ASA1]|uniref:TonB-dependent receptor plug domain-containing protein n=1 Tax=Congregicoccus parvus TaxID=3081749 RepID=UPI002B2D2C41|nr:hypothetical protein ASA1KI_18580 [Opitutales bacterium ASA1]